MPVPADMKIEGFENLSTKLASLGRKGAILEGKALKAGAEPLQKAMQDHINVSSKDQPHLKYNIVVSRTKNDGYDNRYKEVGPDKELAWRAKFLEFGTTKMSARPFMAPAIDETPEEILHRMAEVFRGGYLL